MTLVRPQVILAATSEKPEPRARLAITGLQLVHAGKMTWSKKAIFIRNVPFTAVAPTPRQAAARYILGRIASRAKGTKGLVEGLPPAAAQVKKAWEERRAQLEQALAQIPSVRIERRTIHTVEDHAALLRAKGYLEAVEAAVR